MHTKPASNRKPRRNHTLTRAITLSATLIAAATLNTACVGYETHPPLDGQRTLRQPNSPLVTKPIEAALKWVILRYPPEGDAFTGPENTPIAFSLPEGFSADSYRSILQGLPRNVAPATETNAILPTYIIERVWVRGDEARVDLFRPMTATPPDPASTSQTPIHQLIRIELRGGLKPWNVTAHRTFLPGAFQTPPRATTPATTAR